MSNAIELPDYPDEAHPHYPALWVIWDHLETMKRFDLPRANAAEDDEADARVRSLLVSFDLLLHSPGADEAVEDAHDLAAMREARAEPGPDIPWADLKAELGL